MTWGTGAKSILKFKEREIVHVYDIQNKIVERYVILYFIYFLFIETKQKV